MVILISDLLDDPAVTLAKLGHARQRGFEVMVFQVLTPAEMTLQGAHGDHLRVLDPEAGANARPIDIDVQQVGEDYRRRMVHHLETLRQGCLSMGAAYHLTRTDQPVIPSLVRYLRWRQSRAGGAG